MNVLAKTICVPVCRHKPYFQLLEECSLLRPMYKRVYAFDDSDRAPHTVQKNIIIRYLNPTRWTTNEKGWICNIEDIYQYE